MSTPKITEVLGDQARLLEERVEGYRAIAVKAVAEILQLQSAGHGEKGRRDRASAVIDAAAQKVTALRGSAT